MNVKLYWKYLVGLIVYAILLNIPIFIKLDSIARSITEFFSIHESGNNIGYLMYALLMIIQMPLVIQITKSFMYEILYIITAILVAIMNPYSFLTTLYPPWYLFAFTLVIFLSLMVAIPFLRVLLLVALTVSTTNEILSFYHKPTYAFLAYFILYVVSYIGYFITLNPIRFRPVILFFKTIGSFLFNVVYDVVEKIVTLPRFYLLTIAVLIGFALFHLYIRTISMKSYGGTLLLHKPIPLNTITEYKVPPNYHFTLSYWFYINPTPPSHSNTSTTYTTLSSFGNAIVVAYNASKNKLEVRLGGTSKVKKLVPLQKWNHMAMIYNGGTLDMFMNGELMYTTVWTPETFTKELLLGATNGIDGKICNVMYYDKVKERMFVNALYKDFKRKNPPIV